MTLHRVALHEVPARPWRNGGGTTRELLAWPPGAPHWRLRVSVADITRDGPFSPFPGVRRWFAVLRGEGVRLDLPAGAATITPHDDAIAFDGEAAPGCELLEGPTLDLNLMVQRGAGEARLWRAAAGEVLDTPTRWRGLYATAPLRLGVGDLAEPVAAETLLWCDDADAPAWRLPAVGGAPAWLMALGD